MRELHKRLRRLEGNRPPPQQTELDRHVHALRDFIDTAIGYYLGEPKSHEAPIAAFARALGYAHEGEVLNAMKLMVSEGSNPELAERHARARDKLFAKFDFNLDELNWDDDAQRQEFVEILKRMHAGMSGTHKDLAERNFRFD